jgi:hypothetical protein
MDLAVGNQGIASLLSKFGALSVATDLATILLARMIFGKNRTTAAKTWINKAARTFLATHVEPMRKTFIALASPIHGNGINWRDSLNANEIHPN